MNCDSETLLASAADSGFTKLSRRETFSVLCQLLQKWYGGSDDAGTLLAASAASGFTKLSWRDGLSVWAQLLCDSFGSPVYNAVVVDWVERVLAAGGANPSALTKIAFSRFMDAIQAAGLSDKIYLFNGIAPDSQIAMQTPLIKGNGDDSWTAVGTFSSGNLSVNGYNFNSPTYSMNSGVSPSGQIADMEDVGCFSYLAGYTSGANQLHMGCANAGTTIDSTYFAFSSRYNAAAPYTEYFRSGVITDALNSVNSITGYCSGMRNGSSVETRHANSANPFTQFDSDTVGGSPTKSSRNIHFGAALINASVLFNCKSQLSAVGVSRYLTVTEDSFLYQAIQQMREDLGGGYV